MLLEITFTRQIEDEKREQELIDKIISTVKFYDLKTNPNDEWKTYNNEKYGFEFQYPIDWTFNIRPSDDFLPAETYSILKGNNRISVYPEGMYGDGKIDLSKCTTIKITVAGKNASRFSCKDDGIIWLSEVRFETPLSGREGFTIFLGNYDSNSESIEIFNQILSTFKFTK